MGLRWCSLVAFGVFWMGPSLKFNWIYHLNGKKYWPVLFWHAKQLLNVLYKLGEDRKWFYVCWWVFAVAQGVMWCMNGTTLKTLESACKLVRTNIQYSSSSSNHSYTYPTIWGWVHKASNLGLGLCLLISWWCWKVLCGAQLKITLNLPVNCPEVLTSMHPEGHPVADCIP